MGALLWKDEKKIYHVGCNYNQSITNDVSTEFLVQNKHIIRKWIQTKVVFRLHKPRSHEIAVSNSSFINFLNIAIRQIKINAQQRYYKDKAGCAIWLSLDFPTISKLKYHEITQSNQAPM